MSQTALGVARLALGISVVILMAKPNPKCTQVSLPGDVQSWGTNKARFLEFEFCTGSVSGEGIGWMSHSPKPRWLATWKIGDNYPLYSFTVDNPNSCSIYARGPS